MSIKITMFWASTLASRKLARTNALSNPVSIELVASHPAIGNRRTQPLTYLIEEAGFHGNLFLDPPQAYACLGTGGILSALQTLSSPAQAFWLVMAALVILSGYTAINAVVKAEMFPVEIRALGVGLPYALTVALFGGTADMVALWFKKIGMETGFYGYVTACIACSLLVYLWMPDTRTTSLIDRDPD